MLSGNAAFTVTSRKNRTFRVVFYSVIETPFQNSPCANPMETYRQDVVLLLLVPLSVGLFVLVEMKSFYHILNNMFISFVAGQRDRLLNGFDS